jgi:hypothetical protein
MLRLMKKQIMKSLLLILLTSMSLFASAQKTINDPNVEVRAVSGFHSIHVSSAIDLYLTQSAQETVAISAKDKEDVANIRTEVENGVLKIFFDRKDKWWPKNRKLRAYVSVVSLKELRAGGASDVDIQGTISVEQLNLHLSGASDLTGKLVVTNLLNIHLSGASDAKISGSSREMKIDASGASDLKAYDFRTMMCDVEASGASTINISVEKEMTAKASGASTVNYKGEAVIRDIRTSGASNITRRS